MKDTNPFATPYLSWDQLSEEQKKSVSHRFQRGWPGDFEYQTDGDDKILCRRRIDQPARPRPARP